MDWNIPEQSVFCFIGKGDSAKSTILDAIKYVFHPHWSLSLNDADFYQCNTDVPIVIEATFGDLIDDFRSLQKYGRYLRGWNILGITLSDEPSDNLEEVLTARLTVNKDLEPHWDIICDRNPDGIPFKAPDRIKAHVGFIGEYSERQLTWANGTALAKMTNSENLNEVLVNIARTIKDLVDKDRATTLTKFDEVAVIAQRVGVSLGVPVTDKYQAHLDLSSINFRKDVLALHDNNIPLRQLGLGSRRMLLCGIQKTELTNGHITLFDEIELGLEPYRITRLVKHIKDDKTGQYFLTTHSPSVLRELTISELFIVHNNAGNVDIIQTSSEDFLEYNPQGCLRLSAEAFLAKKIIICEGATEVGFLRGYDNYRTAETQRSFAYFGAALLDAKGANKIKNLAKLFQALGYSVAIIADTDAPTELSYSDIQELTDIGIHACTWAGECSLEERVMLDLPWSSVLESVKFARDQLDKPVNEQIKQLSIGISLSGHADNWEDSVELRRALGQAAKESIKKDSKKNPWFKNMTDAELWFDLIVPAFNKETFKKSDLAIKLTNLLSWIENE